MKNRYHLCLKFVLVFIAGMLIGYMLQNKGVPNMPAGMTESTETKEDGTHTHDDGESHTHGDMLMVDSVGAPSLKIDVTEDPKSGFNVELKTTNFTFAPKRASGEHVANEGHAHLYVNGKKIGRLYGDWVHVDNLESGTHEIRVTLNTNDHRDYAVGDKVIADTKIVTVP